MFSGERNTLQHTVYLLQAMGRARYPVLHHPHPIYAQILGHEIEHLQRKREAFLQNWFLAIFLILLVIFWLVAMCCSALQFVAVPCSVLQCVAVCCSVLQCVAVCCSVLQCVAACCSVWQSVDLCVRIQQ